MSTVCRIGVKYIAEKMDEQQQRLDQALTASVQANPKAGMQGQPLPYQLRSDAFVTGIILICFVLFSYSLKNGKKYVLQRIKALFQYKERWDRLRGGCQPGQRQTILLPRTTGMCLR